MMSDTDRPKSAPRTNVAPWLKIVYLLVVSALAFAAPAVPALASVRWNIEGALFLLQVVILLRCRVSVDLVLRPVVRLKWLFIVLLGCYTFLPSETGGQHVEHWRLPLGGWVLPFNWTGLEQAGLMCVQILTVLLASATVRLTGSGNDLVAGLRALRLPPLFVYSLDYTLVLLSGQGRRGAGRGMGTGDGRGRGAAGRQASEEDDAAATEGGFVPAVRRLIRGDVQFFVRSVERNLEVAQRHVRQEAGGELDERLLHDVAVPA